MLLFFTGSIPNRNPPAETNVSEMIFTNEFAFGQKQRFLKAGHQTVHTAASNCDTRAHQKLEVLAVPPPHVDVSGTVTHA